LNWLYNEFLCFKYGLVKAESCGYDKDQFVIRMLNQSGAAKIQEEKKSRR
jgi:hypothetical protein